ncbi:MAG: HlyC/CorC family transporter [Thiocapsa sp.]|uniref:hemolysin family protein n=1 Tax=Thiocapsa sp. TaxID=2024551 RepID=UPI001BD01794|nr:hemolysin family protein [Thiocapsa sp.]QVL47387.1 MAG: HlyC/CorC family transporter [Thiocapsa sp.]
MDILVLVALILLNGLFAMSEIALVTARRARLARLAEDGDRAAAIAVRLGEEPNRFLSTIQIGITSIGILSGIFGEAALAEPLALWLQGLGMEQGPSEIGSTILVVVMITYFAIVVGELVPKRIGQINPERIARLVARPMYLLSIASRPFVHLLAGSTALLLRLIGQRETPGPTVTEEEIHAMLEEGSDAGVIEKTEHDMVRNVFRLDDRQIGSLMVPRSEVVWLDVNRPLEENLALIAESFHSRFPVCEGGLDDMIGIVTSKQLFNQTLKGEQVDLQKDLMAPVYVPESLTGMELLDQFRSSGSQMVFVVDEYGGVEGLVTLSDVIESVTGELLPHSTEESWAVQREDGSWLLDGLIPILELKDRLGIKRVPEEEKGRYHTLSGMMMWLLGRLPSTGDISTWEGWRLEVVDLDGRRIDKVLATPLPESAVEPPAGPDGGRSSTETEADGGLPIP